MTELKVTLRWLNGTAEVEGWPCGVSGLAVTRWVTPGPGLHIVHVRSGFVIGLFADADSEAVLAAAGELGELADWSLVGTELQAAPEVGRKTAEVVRRWGGDMPGSASPATDLVGEVAA